VNLDLEPVGLLVGPDRITARFDASEDAGATWRKDFDLVFTREK
jgi:hypothetical protein